MRLITIVPAAILLAGCAPLKIGRINADPSRFRNQTVHVTGTVTNSVGLLGKGGYQIEDETGRIYVISGTERYLRDVLVKAIREAALAGGLAELNEDKFTAGEGSVDLMRRFVIVFRNVTSRAMKPGVFGASLSTTVVNGRPSGVVPISKPCASSAMTPM